MLTSILSCSTQDGSTGTVEQTTSQLVKRKMVSSCPPITRDNVRHMIGNGSKASEYTFSILQLAALFDIFFFPHLVAWLPLVAYR